MASPICLYAKVALTTSLLPSLNWSYLSFNFVRLKDSVEEELKIDGGLGLAHRKILRTTPYRTSENAIFRTYGKSCYHHLSLCPEGKLIHLPGNERRTSYADPSFCCCMHAVQRKKQNLTPVSRREVSPRHKRRLSIFPLTVYLCSINGWH